MKISIEAHFDEAKQRHQVLVEKGASEKLELEKDISLKAVALSHLETELKKKEALLRQNEAADEDAPELKKKISKLASQIAQGTKEIESLKRAAQQNDDICNRSFNRENLMARVLKVYGCVEADVVGCSADAFKMLAVEVTEDDEDDELGRPVECRIELAQNDFRKLTIKPSDNHFLKDFLPESLEWLPLNSHPPVAQTQEATGYGRVRAFFDKEAGKLLLSKTVLEWTDTRVRQHRKYGEAEYESRHSEEDFADVAISLGALVDKLMQAEKGQLDLDKPYRDNPLLAHVRSVVIGQTTPTPLFKECSEQLTSDEIYQRIKGDWEAFKNCPWSGSVWGPLALLKHHVENGEKARFWSRNFENQYGFRLRTRDHDWLVGSIFIRTTEQLPPAKTPLTISEAASSHGEPHISASLGRMCLFVARDRSEHERHS